MSLPEIALEQMQLKEFSLISPIIESSHVFKAIETAIPSGVIEQTIGNTQVREERKRKLPSSLVVCLVIAMSHSSNDSMASVLKNLVNGLSREWTKLGKYWRVPNSASISEARQRLGSQVMSRLSRASSPPTSYSPDSQSIFGGTAGDGNRRYCAGCTRLQSKR
jgi:hypothetical protein